MPAHAVAITCRTPLTWLAVVVCVGCSPLAQLIALGLTVELGKLFPVSAFGDMALLDRWDGRHEGFILADSYVEYISIHKDQIDASLLTPEVLKVRECFCACACVCRALSRSECGTDAVRRRCGSGRSTSPVL